MYTINSIESVNSSFPNENALLKLLYLRITELYKKWNGRPVCNGAMGRSQLLINDKFKIIIEKHNPIG